MEKLQLNLTKAGESAPKFQLNIKKGEPFKVFGRWDDGADLDLHALYLVHHGDGVAPKLTGYDDILSTYNTKTPSRPNGHLVLAADRTFAIHDGALRHSADARNGHAAGVDEFIEVDTNRIVAPAGGAVEIVLAVSIHREHPNDLPARFSQVKGAHVEIVDAAGKVVLSVALSDQFGEFNGVQMGSIMVDHTGAAFHNVGVGFNDSFNDVIAHFAP